MTKRRMANRKLTAVINRCAEAYPFIDPAIVRDIWLKGYSFSKNDNNNKTKNPPFNKPTKQMLQNMKILMGFYPFSKNFLENPTFNDAYFRAELQKQVQDSGCNWDQVLSAAKSSAVYQQKLNTGAI